MATRRARPKNNYGGGRRRQQGGQRPDGRSSRALEEALVMRSRVLESMVEGVSISDERGVILYTNPAEDTMFGYERGELVGLNVSVQNTYPPEENARIVQEVIGQLKTRGSWQGEFLNRKKDGTPFTTFARITALDVSGKPYWVCVQEDVTLRRATEAALRSSQERLALAHQAARLGTFDWNIQTNEVVWSREEEGLYGLPPGGFGGAYANWSQAVHPEDRGRAERAVLEAARTGADLDTEFRVVWPDGSTRWLSAKARVLCDSTGRPQRMIGVSEDITGRKQAEAERAALLQAAQTASAQTAAARAQLEALLERITDSVVAFDHKWRYTYVNTQTTRLIHRSREELIGRQLWDVFPEAQDSPDFPKMKRTMEEQIPLVFENYNQELDLWTEAHTYPSPEGMTIFIRDISAQKQIERVARQAMERTARLQTMTAALVGALTATEIAAVVLREGLAAVGGDAGSIAVLTPAGDALELLHAVGYSDEVLAKVWRTSAQDASPQADTLRDGQPSFVHNRAAARARWPYLAAVQPQIPWHAWANLPLFVDGRAVGYLGVAFLEEQAFDDDVRRFLLTLAQQCSQALERARLYEAEQQARARAEHIQRRMAFLADVTIRLTTSLEYTTRLEELARLAVPTLADWCIVYMQQADGWITRVAVAHIDPEQERRLQTLQAQDRIDPDGPNPIAQVFRSGQAAVDTRLAPEDIVLRTQGQIQQQINQELRPRAYMAFPLRIRDQVIGAMGFVLGDPSRRYTDDDVTFAAEVARRAALALDNARLYRDAQDAIELRDQFLSVAAHELKTPLTSLLGNAQLLQRRDQREGLLGPRERRSVEIIVDQATRLNRMVSTLLDISRLEAGQLTIERRLLDLCALVRRIVEEAAPNLAERRLDLRCPDELVLVEGDELRLEQVFQNLLQNAVKYSPPDAPVAVEVARQAGGVTVAVRDRGIGIPSEAVPQLFQRFFRASNVSGSSVVGLGIGLYVVREIVALHGGTVEVASVEGQGSMFTVRLPLADPPAPPTGRA